MSASRRSRVLGPLLLAWGAAETGVRLLSPREQEPPPAPIDVRSYFTAEEIERGARFARPQLALSLARGAIELAVLAVLARRGPRFMRDAEERPFARGALAGAGLAVALSAPPLPLAAVARRRAQAVGLVTQSWRGWAADLAKAAAIQAVLAAAAGGAVAAVTRRYPRGWWAPAAAGSVILDGVFAVLAPVVLDPLFNRFTPLADGQTRRDVLELAEQAGVRVGDVYTVDASRRTTAANAYVAGLGPTKRVVLFDTLLERYSRDEVRLVVAHELAHVHQRDVWRQVLYAAIVAGPTALAAQRLSWLLTPARGMRVTLPALGLSVAIVSVPIGLLSSRLSRAMERRADAFSLELAGSPEAFLSFERRIALQNVADLEPPRWFTSLLSTHPPTAERIGAAVAFMQRDGAGATA